MKPFVTQVWPQFTADQQFCAAFGSVLVDRVELYRTQRQVVICLRSAEPLDQALCGRLCASLAEVFAGYELQVRSYFAYPNITPEAVRLMIEELKEKIYDIAKDIHSARFPFNDFLYRDFEIDEETK